MTNSNNFRGGRVGSQDISSNYIARPEGADGESNYDDSMVIGETSPVNIDAAYRT